jgi:hypothetical protein
MPDLSKYSPDKPFVPSFFSQVNLGNAFIPSVTNPDVNGPSGVGEGNDTWGFFLRGASNPFAGMGIVPSAPAAATDYWSNQKFSSESGEYQSGNTLRDIGFLIGRDNEDLWAKNRTWWDESFNSVVRLFDKAGAYTVQGFGFLGGLIGIGNKHSNYHSGSNFADWIAGAADNGLAAWGRDAGENVDNIYRPIYNEASDRDAGFFKRMFTDLDFWKGEITDAAGFLLSAYVTAGLTGELRLGERALRGINSWRGLQFADEAAALSSEGLTGMSEAASLSGAAQVTAEAAPVIPNILGREAGAVVTSAVKEAGNFANAQRINMGVATLVNTASEAMVEASSLKNNLAEQLMREKNPDGTMKYSPEEVRDITAKAARNGFLLNMLVLAPSNLWEIKTLFGSKVALSSRNSANKLIKHEGGILSDAEIVKRTFGQKGLDYIRNAGQGVLTEGLWEENIQLAIERVNSEPENIDLPFYKNLGRSLNQYVKQTAGALTGTDPDAAMSIGIGGLIGGGMSVRGRVRDLNQLKKDVVNYNDAISTFRTTAKDLYVKNPDGTIQLDSNNNPVIDNASVLSYVATLNKTLSMTELADNLKAKNMNLLHSIVDNDNIARLVKAYADNGMIDVLLNKIDNASGFKSEDLSLLGLSSNTEYNNARIETIKKRVQRQKGIYDNIERNFLVNIKNDDKFGSKKRAMKQSLYFLSSRAAHLAELKDEVDNRANVTSSEITTLYSSPSDAMVDMLNDLHNQYLAAKKRVDMLSTQGPRSLRSSVRMLPESGEETIDLGNGTTITTPKKQKPVHIEEVEAVDEETLNNAVTELNKAEAALKKHLIDNKDEVKNLRKNADGSFRYEIDEKNRLMWESGTIKDQRISKDIEMARNATLNVYNRIQDIKFGERYWDNMYGRRKQDLEDEVINDESDEIEGNLTDDVPPTPSAGPEETISPEQAEEIKKEAKESEDLYDEQFDLEREKEFFTEKEELLTPEEEARLQEIDERLDLIDKTLKTRSEERENENKVQESENIKPEDKVQYTEVLNKISENKKRVKKFNTHYEIDGKYFRKVSEIIGDNITVDQSAANKGYTVDAIVKAFFANEISEQFKSEIAQKISEDALNEMIKQLETIKNRLTQQGVEIVADNVVVFDEELGVAGEIDLLGVDKFGNFKVFEISARRPEIYRIYGKAGKGISIRELDGKRLSAYRNLFANQYQAVPDEISVMFPFAVTYDKANPDGFIEKVKLKDKIRFIPERNVEIKLKTFKPIRSGSKFDNFDLFTLFSKTYVPPTMQQVRDKLNFLFRNESFDNIRKNLTLRVSNLDGELLTNYQNQQKLLNGEKVNHKLNKAAYLNSFGNRVEFDNLYALRNSKSMALYYSNELVGYLSPIPALAYKDANGVFQILNPATDEQTYSDVTGNSKQTYADFQKLAKAYTQSYKALISRLEQSGENEITIDNNELQDLFEVNMSYGELDKIGVKQSRPLLNDLDFRGVKVGNKNNVITVVNLDDQDGVRIVMDKTKRTTSVLKKLQDLDKWANVNVQQIKTALTDSKGAKVSNWAAIVETPNGEYKVISLRETGSIPLDVADDFVVNLGEKFTASVTKTVFKNQNMQVVPKVTESSVNIDLKDAEVLGKIYPAEDIESIEKFGMDVTDLNTSSNEDKVNNFINDLTEDEFSEINSKFAAFPQTKEELANDILDEYHASSWSSIEDFLNDLKNCP